MSIYNPGTRLGLIHALVEMRTYLDKDEQELKDLTDSTIAKLNGITDAEFRKLDLVPDFLTLASIHTQAACHETAQSSRKLPIDFG